MILPPLYKYLDVRGAKLTLANKTFKHAKPSDFNDIEDLTVQSMFLEDLETALRKIESGFTDVILRHLDEPPTCESPLKEKLALIQHVYRTNADAAEVVKSELQNGEPAFDVEHMRARSSAFIEEVNQSLQDYRVLCVTTHIDSEGMWSGYAENHAGIALRIEPNLAKDSKFQLFRPVVYRENRPPLYEEATDFVAHSLFGDQEANRKVMIEKIVYAKTLKWQNEGEYRLAIPVLPREKPWVTLSYHPEEITELYLGLAMVEADRTEIIGSALRINPEIAIFQMQRDKNEKLTFRRIRVDAI